MIQEIPPVSFDQVLPDSIPDPKQELELLKSMPIDEFVDLAVNRIVTFTLNLAVSILVFYLGKFIITKVTNLMSVILIKRKVDKSLSTFMLSLVRMILYFLLIVIVIGILGIETSSFIALFASAGVAIGLALSGTLQNFAGGVLILLIKPYKVGDYIEAQGYAGTVKEIQIFNTIITTPDNKSIIIPNGGLSTSSVNNYNREDYRRVDWTISISYGDDVDQARQAILDICHADNRIVKQYIEDDRREWKEAIEAEAEEEAREKEEEQHNWLYRLFHRRTEKVKEKLDDWQNGQVEKVKNALPKVDRSPVVWVSALADSSVNLSVRVWTRSEHYWPLYFGLNEKFYKELPKCGVHFPFPQLDVHLSDEKKEA